MIGEIVLINLDVKCAKSKQKVLKCLKKTNIPSDKNAKC